MNLPEFNLSPRVSRSLKRFEAGSSDRDGDRDGEINEQQTVGMVPTLSCGLRCSALPPQAPSPGWLSQEGAAVYAKMNIAISAQAHRHFHLENAKTIPRSFVRQTRDLA
jgi:hypothetical protein